LRAYRKDFNHEPHEQTLTEDREFSLAEARRARRRRSKF